MNRTVRFVLASSLAAPLLPAQAEVPRMDWISITPGEGVVRVMVATWEKPHVFDLSNPSRLVIDVPALDRLPAVPPVPAGLSSLGVKRVRHSQFRSVADGAITRVVLDLDEVPIYDVDIAAGRAVITVNVPASVTGQAFVIGAREDPEPRSVSQSPDRDDPYAADDLDAASPVPVDEPRGVVEAPGDIRAERTAFVRNRRAEDLVKDADAAREAGDPKTAVERADRAIRHYPDAPSTGSARLITVDALFDASLEVDAYRRLAEVLDDGTSTAADRRGAIVRLMRRRPPAWTCPAYVQLAELAMEADGQTDDERARIGGRLGVHLAQSEGDLARALSLLDAALKTKPNASIAAEFHAALGYCHQRLKDYGRAAKAYAFAHDLVEKSAPVRARELRLRSADVWYRAGETAKAGKAYALVAHDENASEGDRSWALFQEGNCHFRARRFDLAANRYRELLATYPLGTWSKGARIRLALVGKKLTEPEDS
jgi:tetratricopeptide (TPR) repeat protein